jgi:hypothetical protein
VAELRLSIDLSLESLDPLLPASAADAPGGQPLRKETERKVRRRTQDPDDDLSREDGLADNDGAAHQIDDLA